MNSVKIGFNTPSDVEQIAALSRLFADENCCNGVIADDSDFFKTQKTVVAVADNKIVGYGYGTIETKQKNTSLTKAGEKSYFIEEIYVLPEYRNAKIGQRIFEFMENYAEQCGCNIVEVAAVSKNYGKLLAFYIDKLGMNFWSAHLIKRIGE